MKQSAIGWTDFSGGDLNFVTGCTPVSEGCAHCYARAIYRRWGRDFGMVTVHDAKLSRLARAKFPEYSPKREAPHKPMAFVVDTGDLFHEDVPDMVIAQAISMMEDRADVTWQVLTKRAERMRRWFAKWHTVTLPDNIWLGVTAENQQRANERIPLLLDTPAAVRFVSVEPMLEPVTLIRNDYSWLTCTDTQEHTDDGDYDHECCESFAMGNDHYHGIDWIIAGAESGPNRRPFDAAWAASLYAECAEAGVPFFGKQDSGLRPGVPLLIDGQEIKQWPQ